MTSPSDMTAKAEQVLDLMCCNVPEAGDVRQASIADIAAALSEAREQGRREGLKRAAEIAASKAKTVVGETDFLKGYREGRVSASAAILSEAGRPSK